MSTQYKQTYREMLRDPRWQRKRLEIMQRDDFACTICGDRKSTLNVHHKYYVWGQMPWEYPDSVFTTLCADCHEAESWEQADFKEIVQGILRDGYTYEHLNQYLSGLQGPVDMDKSELVRIASFVPHSANALAYAQSVIESGGQRFIESLPK